MPDILVNIAHIADFVGRHTFSAVLSENRIFYGLSRFAALDHCIQIAPSIAFAFGQVVMLAQFNDETAIEATLTG